MKLSSDDLPRVDQGVSAQRIELSEGDPPAILTLSDMLKIPADGLAPAAARGRRIRPHKNAE